MTYYAVYKGKVPGVYRTWDECKTQTLGFSGAQFKKFNDVSSAQYYQLHGTEPKPPSLSLDTYLSLNPSSVKKDKQSETIFTINKSNTNLEIYTDGSLIRRGKKCYAGYGVYIPNLQIEKAYILKSPKTNNRAELSAIIKAIKLTSSQNLPIIIYTDSQYSIQIATGTGRRYQQNNYQDGKGKLVKNDDLIKKLLPLLESNSVKFNHIRAHTGKLDRHSLGNDKADSLAVKGATGDLIKSLANLGDYCVDKTPLSKLDRETLLQRISQPKYLAECRKSENKRLEYEVISTYLNKDK